MKLFIDFKVTVIFTSGISESLAKELENLGANVEGERILDSQLGIRERIRVSSDFTEKFTYDESTVNSLTEQSLSSTNDDVTMNEENARKFKNPSLEGVTKLNLDITAFLAYLSNICNGHSNVKFPKIILANQAKAEQVRPQKPILDKIFQGILFLSMYIHTRILFLNDGLKL
jgi:hypothetical protein